MRTNLYMDESAPKYIIAKNEKAFADAAADSETIKTLWHGFCYTLSDIDISVGSKNTFVIGKGEKLSLAGCEEYAYKVTENGITVQGCDKNGLLRGIMALMQTVEPYGKDGVAVPVCEVHGVPTIKVRMVHLCIFPETTLDFVQKFTRLAGVLKYSHIVYEFWGMLKYDCLPELAWECAYSKEELLPIIKEARDMGMEVVPMFNHLGHAAMARGAHGKHVVLDQDPSLQRLFMKDGWIWNIKSDEVKELLSKVRAELCELCGESKYFFIGCDEAYMFGQNPEYAELLAAWLSYLTDELEKIGRRPVMWGDMLLEKELCGAKDTGEFYSCNCADKKSAELLFSKIDRRMIIADWQYDAKKAPIVTTPYLVKKGYDVLCCPWFDHKNIEACCKTVKDCEAYGVVETTWHTLSNSMHSVTLCSWCSWEPDNTERAGIDISADTAALVRRVWKAKSIKDAGWAEIQVGVFY